MWSGIAAAGIGVLGSIAGNIMMRNSMRSNQRDAETLSWDQWHANNAYNHPSAQMARFREAGLNPNLVYGHMPTSPPPTFTRSPGVESYDFGLDKLAEAIRDDEAFDLTKKSTEHAMALQDANLELAKESSLRNDREMDMRDSLLPYQQAEIASRIALNKAHKNAVEKGKFGVSDIIGDIWSTGRNTGREARGIWKQIIGHPGWKKYFSR